ncbi:MAG TPA: type II secretion system minor pseudopilin GspJ [Allosphingosinicella sp.]|uniref:type II secretion system minor pseudopilin GspJ n=1 Tax=Allosphingosinicella sp. TaxID=2823234 RepID=UPI002F272572
MKQANGFTLVELLVALTIFALLAAAGVGLLSFSVRAQEVAGERLKTLSQTRRAGALLTGDLAQAASRVSRDEAGAARPALLGGSGQSEALVLALVRRGWENLDDTGRPSLQKVEYRLVGDRLERIAYPRVDGAPPLPAVPVATGVRSLRLRYRDGEGQWRDRWDPTQPSLLPLAVEMVIDTQASGRVRQLFLVGAAP